MTRYDWILTLLTIAALLIFGWCASEGIIDLRGPGWGYCRGYTCERCGYSSGDPL